MNRYKEEFSIALQLCPVVLLLALAASSAAAQKATAPSTEVEALQGSSIRNITVPPMPDKLQVKEGFTAFLEGHAGGTPNYVCRSSGSGFGFVLSTPQAILFSDAEKQIM